MTVQEFSDQFDTLVSSYRRFKRFDNQELLDSIEFNEYEKSIFLTNAQEDIVKELYSGKYTGESFESSEKLRRELESLVTQVNYSKEQSENQSDNTFDNVLRDNKYIHTTFSLPDDIFYIVYEQVIWDSDNECLNGNVADVVPVTHDEFWRIRNNPFRGPSSKRVLRLDNNNLQVELVSNANIGSYIIRYLKRPEPIVLVNLPNESINGVTAAQTCELSEALHRDILDRAVRLAIMSKGINFRDKGEK